jgi:RNA polymerase sigma factor (sigma-70 family)
MFHFPTFIYSYILKHFADGRCLLIMFDEKFVIERVLQGDRQAFELLVKQYEKLVTFVVYRLMKNREDLEDVCQDVFIKVHRNLAQFDFKSKLASWIASIAYRTAINHLKKNKHNQSIDYPENLDHFHFTHENPGEILTKKDALAQLERLIAELPEKYRIVVTLYHLKEFSYSEIGEITGLAEGTVKTHLFRARQLLKENLIADKI